ncbi:winged helix-turn-helix transcriptional regulator [Microbacterium sp. SYP-A9085]|uniref:Fic family protein n=1 Tax=Microbacterium sp. SYP-A9085 TaxID=2664454 RepID=UPI00129B7696|nr:Fic family protein [Microbacterium sp. SYP-A9085]MRH29600.1 winged helix-turn-helix transcriptional regulator [Microbacterium sp. SYP-A9085]
MGEYVERLWQPEDAAGLSRKDRTAGRYLAYVPGELGDRLPVLSAVAQGAAEDALAVLARADERIGERGRYLNHLLIRSESISSSWIEGNRVSPKRLAIAELLREGPRQALDVVANVRATEAAIAELADRDRAITTEDIVDLQHVIEPRLARGLRQEQNWVGGPGWSPLRAAFVPPPEGEVERLVADLARFATDTAGNPVVRAAIVHAQFETIHPFIDGNGRTGRALIHTVLRRADALRNALIPISTVFAGDTDSYIAGLTDYRADPPRLDEWVTGFAQAAERAAGNAVRLAEDIAALDARVRDELVAQRRARGASPAVPRRDAVVLRILDTLASDPVLTAESVSTRLGVSPAAAHRALTELAEAGILNRAKERGRLVCWTADRHLGLVALTERSNRVGAEDTRNRRPARGPALPDLTRYGLGGASHTSRRDAPGL